MFKVIFSIIIFSKFLFASIGTVTSLEGKATIQREGKNIIALAGIEIEKKDIVSTELNSKLKITLIDNTIITIGKESTLNIEEYIFDNIKADNSATELNFVKGAFHTITGEIGKINPSKFKLKTKSASIGIRGTEIYGDENIVICTSGIIDVTSFGITSIVPSGNYIETFIDKIPSSVKPIEQDLMNEFKTNFENNRNLNTEESDKLYFEKVTKIIDNEIENKKVILEKTKFTINEGDSSKSGTLKATTTSDSTNFTYTTNSSINGFTLNSDGTYTFDPSNSSYDSLKRGETKNLVVPITVKDENGLTATSSIEIKVIGNSDLTGKHLGATSTTLEVDSLTSSMNVYSDKLVLNSYTPVQSVELAYNNFKNSYSSHSDIGTLSFSQTVNSNSYTGSYTIHSDDMGEFVVGYSNDETYKSLFYDGLVSSKSILDNSKIYTYKVYKGLNVNYLDNNETIKSVALNTSTTKLININAKTSSISSIDTSNKIEESGFKFEVAKLNSNGTIDAKAYKIITDNEGVAKDVQATLSGQLYGSAGQGIGLTGDLTTYTSAVSTSTLYTSPSVSNTSKIIDTYYLDNNSTKTNNSTGTSTFEGLSTAIYTGELQGNTKTANKITFDINKSTGEFSNGKISLLSERTSPYSYVDTFGIAGTVDALTSYYVNDDNFGVKINSYIPTSDGYKLIDNSSWIVSISDKVNSDGTFSENIDNESSWGYWTSNSKDANNNIQNINAYSTWVSGTKTSVDYVQNLINSSTNTILNFKGNIIGAIQNGGSLSAIKLDTNNVTNLAFTLGSQSGSFTGDFTFKTQAAETWSGNFSGTANASGFSGTNFTNLNIAGSAVSDYSGNIDGNYYGTNEIKSVGGSINIINTGNGNLVGSFKADKN